MTRFPTSISFFGAEKTEKRKKNKSVEVKIICTCQLLEREGSFLVQEVFWGVIQKGFFVGFESMCFLEMCLKDIRNMFTPSQSLGSYKRDSV